MSDCFAATRFVLVEPSHPGNVGAAARALKTMGFGRLVLVRPREPDVRAHPEARAMASGADDVLAAACEVASLDAALAGVHWSLALSARTREFGPPVLSPRQAARHAADRRPAPAACEIALVFGNERTGLANHDVERCAAIAHIDANPAYSSLNLAQAIQVLAYEMRIAYRDATAAAAAPAAAATAAPGLTAGDTLATGSLATDALAATRASAAAEGAAGWPEGQAAGRVTAAAPTAAAARAEDIERLFQHLEQGLIAIDFLDPAHPKKLMSRLRRLFARSGLENEEVHLLRGIAKQMLLTAGQAPQRR
ncbi:RNA methyltransferase [Chitinasiproducens palmae]|uniref:tRNA/rRNA methyltransferase n=1 Tax=Chitinasiproducens palmae TaxID=1770053 RepID=A0A1H2PRV5_9BURK|nr:RNA methyltransferase [Chitinasiproducens palmae]SDV49659.1 tRNA/rRNA methyltransferase [Chitinasiproducens palmae]